MRDVVMLEEFEVPCVVGITEGEQRRIQPVVVSLAMEASLRGAEAGDLSQSVNYFAVQQQVISLIQFGQWRLIETMVAGIARLILAAPHPLEERAAVSQVKVAVRKPTILDGATPGVQVIREPEFVGAPVFPQGPGATVTVLCETPRAGAYRVVLDAGATIDVPPGAGVHCVTAVQSDAGRAYSAGDRIAWGEVSRLSAPKGQDAVVLMVGTPSMGWRA